MAAGKDFVLAVLEMYRNRPCLWQVNNEDYFDRDKRNMALADLLILFKSVDPNATIETVKKKISSMRGSFKKELNKASI